MELTLTHNLCAIYLSELEVKCIRRKKNDMNLIIIYILLANDSVIGGMTRNKNAHMREYQERLGSHFCI